MECDLSVTSKALWANLGLQAKIDEWAERNGIRLKPIHRIEPTNLSTGNKRKLPGNLEEIEIEYQRLGSSIDRAELLKNLSDIYKEEKNICFFKDWLEQKVSNLKETILPELEQKFILVIAKYRLKAQKLLKENSRPKLFLQDEHENPFFDGLTSQNNITELCCEQGEEEELIDLAEKVALEQALCGKTAQEMEVIIEMLLPNANVVQPFIGEKIRTLRRTLLDILGGKHEEQSEVSSPVKGLPPSRSFRSNISMDIFKKRHRERNPPRRLSDKDLMLKRILDHRVISMDELSQPHSNKKRFSIEHSSNSRQITPSQEKLGNPATTQSIAKKGSSPQNPLDDNSYTGKKKSAGIFKFKKVSTTPKEDIELSATQ